MEASTVEQQEDGPVEGAEATRTADHLFQYSTYVHAGAGADECEHREDGKCDDPEHFHAWLCLPNSLQNRDIQDKAKAAKARKKRAMNDAGGEGRPPSDAFVTLESELDDLLSGDRKPIIDGLAEREVREHFGDYMLDVQERFENYQQDREEWLRLAALPEEERPDEEYQQLDARMTKFGEAVEERITVERDREAAALEKMSEADLRERLREARIVGEANEASQIAYYTWLAFVGTRRCPGGLASKRYYSTMDDFRAAPPEAVREIDAGLRDLEQRTIRGDAAGN